LHFKKTKRSSNIRQSGNETPPKAVYSYYSNRSETKNSSSNRQTAPRKDKWQFIKHLPGYCALGVIVLCVGYVLTLSSTPNVIIFNQSKLPPFRNTDEYSQVAKELLGATLVNKTKITIDSTKIENSLREHFPELSNAVVTLPIIGRRPVVKLEIAPAVLIIRLSGQDYLISASGRSILSADKADAENIKNLPVVVDESDLQAEPGQGVMTSAEVDFIRQVIAQLRTQNLTITSLILPQLPSELHIRIKNINYLVKFDMQGDARLQAGSFLAVKKRLESQNKNPSQYIDVRVEDKAYYK